MHMRTWARQTHIRSTYRHVASRLAVDIEEQIVTLFANKTHHVKDKHLKHTSFRVHAWTTRGAKFRCALNVMPSSDAKFWRALNMAPSFGALST